MAGFGTGWALRSLPIQTFLGFHGYKISLYMSTNHPHCRSTAWSEVRVRHEKLQSRQWPKLCKHLGCTCVFNLKVYLHLQAVLLSQDNPDALTELPSHPAFSWHLVPLASLSASCGPSAEDNSQMIEETFQCYQGEKGTGKAANAMQTYFCPAAVLWVKQLVTHLSCPHLCQGCDSWCVWWGSCHASLEESIQEWGMWVFNPFVLWSAPEVRRNIIHKRLMYTWAGGAMKHPKKQSWAPAEAGAACSGLSW